LKNFRTTSNDGKDYEFSGNFISDNNGTRNVTGKDLKLQGLLNFADVTECKKKKSDTKKKKKFFSGRGILLCCWFP
jgi:hypothetical protein